MTHDTDGLVLGVLAIANFSLAGLRDLLADLEPFMHFLLTAGQIGVAVVTVVFVIKKMRALKKSRSDK